MRTTEEETGEQIALQLVRLLHQGTSTDEFTQCMVEVEALPAGMPGKSTASTPSRTLMAARSSAMTSPPPAACSPRLPRIPMPAVSS